MAGLGIVMKDRLPKGAMARTVVGNTFRYLFFGAARNWFRNMGSIAPALGSMTLLLLMAGIAGLTGYAINNLERVESGQASLLHVYIRDGAPSADVNSLWDRLAADPRVASVDYVTTGQALERAQSMPGLPQLADASQSNPFPASLDVQVKNIDEVAAIAAYVRVDTAVDPVYPTSYDKGAYQRIQAVIFGVAVAGIAFLGVLAFVAVTVTINSVRAAIHSRRDEVTIMQLVGARRWMVRGPFVVEGAITGAIAGTAAGLGTFALTMAGISAGAGTFVRFAPGITMSVAAMAAVMVLALGVGLGSGSSLVSVRRHLES
ncbi:MAG TPA: permease-like cell division protein FtsX [Candidatus Dormibacteraeota bacterium]|nr:permease-like cell division protein FtsX [Candidatus Dormibacteraeota bacterium]